MTAPALTALLAPSRSALLATGASTSSTISPGLDPVGLLALIGAVYAVAWIVAFAIDDVRGLRAR